MKCMRVVGIVCVVVCVGLASAAELPKGFRLEPVVSGLTNPSSLAGTPDGRILITERTTGNVRQLRNGMLQAAPLCSVAVDAVGEGGLLGVAVHPDFSSNHWIYLYYTDLASGNNRVVRFEIGSTSCNHPPSTILDNLGSGASLLRNGGGMSFGPDGKLYIATGDMQDGSNGQNAGTLQGKVLRVNDNGSIPSDNPTPGSLVYSKGLRDGRGLAVGSGGTVYVSDGGNDGAGAHDELDAPAAGDNLGWPIETGSGGTMDPPLVAWLPTVGVHGVTAYAGTAFPDLAADGVDNDHDGYGPDHHPGVGRVDDNGVGTCIGSANNGNACASTAACGAALPGEPSVNCEKRDDPAEYCPGGVPAGDDACGSTGAAGVDEPDESYPNNVFAASGSGIQRAVVVGAGLDQLSTWSSFLDSAALPDCPTGWTGVMTGRDGWLYALATNGGGAAGALYRVTHEGEAGPREVSAEDSYFPLILGKPPVLNRVDLFWEDLRDDAKQPRDGSGAPALPVREYRVWMGSIGDWDSHTPMASLDAIPGDEVNGALRKAEAVVFQTNVYFLVSARSDNLEGTLGYGTAEERAGPAVKDLCDTIGYHASPTYLQWKCGKNFTLTDPYGIPVSLYEKYRGHPILLDFSAVWCPPCHTQANVMEALYQTYANRGVEMITVLMDEDSQALDFNGRPSPAECRNWEDRPGASPDHTFDCWVDPNVAGPQKAWPLYNKHGALPTNVLLDSGLRVAYTAAGYSEAVIKLRLNQMVGTVDSCLH